MCDQNNNEWNKILQTHEKRGKEKRKKIQTHHVTASAFGNPEQAFVRDSFVEIACAPLVALWHHVVGTSFSCKSRIPKQHSLGNMHRQFPMRIKRWF